MNLTAAQLRAASARGNVLVSAAAGTGKTGTLVARCLRCLGDPAGDQPRAALDEILVVTFTEAAAAEMRERIRARLEEKLRAAPGDAHWEQQLMLFEAAHIGTLHSFCFRLARRHFYELQLDPQLKVLDEGAARLFANESVDAVLQRHYAALDERAEAVRRLVQSYGGRGDRAIRGLILRLHDYMQTRPNPPAWLEEQLAAFAAPEPEHWRQWLRRALADWRQEWEPRLANLAAQNQKAAECLALIRALPPDDRSHAFRDCFSQLQAAAETWPKGKKTLLKKPLEDFFEASAFLGSLLPAGDADPLREDWNWLRGHMTTLLRLAGEFEIHYRRAKRESAAADFHDLEQFALQLLWDFEANRPTDIARQWRRKIRHVFVDEYQDINAAQDKIIEALSRDTFVVPPSGGQDAKPPEGGTPNGGNRFLVGDVKQSIYRFRLADPAIFSSYEKNWQGAAGQTLSLVENFRSREGLLQFINEFFALLMRPALGGVNYDETARLQFAGPRALSLDSDPAPRVELLLRLKGKGDEPERGAEAAEGEEPAEVLDAEKEARLLALRLRKLKTANHRVWDRAQNRFRAVQWRDMAVLLRAPAGKAESYAKAFAQTGVPLAVERSGFYESNEVADLLNLLMLLDNPLQDVPAIAVLHSPLVGLTLNELAAVRLALPREHFWSALLEMQQSKNRPPASQKLDLFLARFSQWRRLARQVSLSRCLETMLAETRYEDWLRGQDRGEQRRANVRQFVGLARRFDEFQQQGLFRFLRFVEAQQEADTGPEVAAVIDENAVRLMSIHQSKGLEFPVVALADLGKGFNLSDLQADLILDEEFGLCAQINPPDSAVRYPSLPHWLARRRQAQETLGEEMRLLYVAMTRAADTLILAGSISRKKWATHWNGKAETHTAALLAAGSYADWFGAWFSRYCAGPAGAPDQGATPLLRWAIQNDSLWAAAGVEIADPAPGGGGIERMAGAGPDLRERLAWEYPFAAATRKPAKASVSALRREANEPDEEAQALFAPGFKMPASDSTSKIRATPAIAAEVGSAHHRFLQWVPLDRTGGIDALREEAAGLEHAQVLSTAEAKQLDFEALAAFWQSDLGGRVRAEANAVRRELAFTARFTPAEIAAVTGRSAESLRDEFVVVQGIVDLAVILPAEIRLVDFKTDEVREDELAERTRSYEPQLKLYALALERIYGRPVTERWIYFLARRKAQSLGKSS
jgi:ATP-dependent helicase/nuclease subunit A